MSDDPTPSTISLWLEEALAGWILPVSGLVLAGAAWGLYQAGLLPEAPTGGALAVLMGVVVALLMVRPALSPEVNAVTRGLVLGTAAAAAAFCIGASLGAVLPGVPLARGDLAQVGDVLPLPAGTDGRVRLLVHSPLPPGGTPQVVFRLAGGAAPIDGQVERTVSYARVGRGSRAAVTHDLNETWVTGTLAHDAAGLRLEKLSGQAAGPLQVSVYQQVVPGPMLWLLALAILIAAAAGESRLGAGSTAPLAGMALAYGLLVAFNATPSAAVGTSLGAILLGGLGGALAGGVAAALARLIPWKVELHAERRRRGPRGPRRPCPARSTAQRSRRRPAGSGSTRSASPRPARSIRSTSTTCSSAATRPTWPGSRRSGPSGSTRGGSCPVPRAWWRWRSPTGAPRRARPAGPASAGGWWRATPAAATTTRS
jgi:hypothetical protein